MDASELDLGDRPAVDRGLELGANTPEGLGQRVAEREEIDPEAVDDGPKGGPSGQALDLDLGDLGDREVDAQFRLPAIGDEDEHVVAGQREELLPEGPVGGEVAEGEEANLGPREEPVDCTLHV